MISWIRSSAVFLVLGSGSERPRCPQVCQSPPPSILVLVRELGFWLLLLMGEELLVFHQLCLWRSFSASSTGMAAAFCWSGGRILTAVSMWRMRCLKRRDKRVNLVAFLNRFPP